MTIVRPDIGLIYSFLTAKCIGSTRQTSHANDLLTLKAMQERNLCSQGTNPTAISGFRTKHQSNCTIVDDGNGNDFKITKII